MRGAWTNAAAWIGRPVAAALLLVAWAYTSARAGSIAEAVRPFIERGEVAGAVTLVADRDRVLHLEAHGLADLERGAPMRSNTLFWIASMTKPVTAALLWTFEERWSLDDPLDRHLPEFAGLPSRDGAREMPLLRHLMTHTSGLETVPSDDPCATLADLVAASARRPLRFAPGSK